MNQQNMVNELSGFRFQVEVVRLCGNLSITRSGHSNFVEKREHVKFANDFQVFGRLQD
jgi:hypothetical protein